MFQITGFCFVLLCFIFNLIYYFCLCKNFVMNQRYFYFTQFSFAVPAGGSIGVCMYSCTQAVKGHTVNIFMKSYHKKYECIINQELTSHKLSGRLVDAATYAAVGGCEMTS